MQDSITNISAPQQFVQQETPAEIVPLPSKGITYPQGTALCNRDSVGIRAMTARDEDILTSRALLKSGKAIPTLLSNCIVDKNVDTGKMLAGDRNAILIGIRITGYGSSYRVDLTCPSCTAKISQDIDLSALPLKRIPENVTPIKPNTNEFEYVMPVSGKKVTFNLMTGDDEQELLSTYERARKSNIAEEVVTTRLRHQIVSINGETDKGKLVNVIRSLPARDSRSLRQYIDSITPGVELKTIFSCPICDYSSEEVEVPLGTEFFWPTN